MFLKKEDFLGTLIDQKHVRRTIFISQAISCWQYIALMKRRDSENYFGNFQITFLDYYLHNALQRKHK